MLFNSIDFAIFLPIAFLLYWFVFNSTLKIQNSFLLIASYLFYGWWDWRFLFLIFFSSIVDYSIGLCLSRERNEIKRKYYLWTSLLINLGILGFFKYYNFFLDNFRQAYTVLGYSMDAEVLNIVLPVGISFYTFQTLSYTIDVYRKNLEPSKNFVEFATFVSFFPQLVAGPIERATHLLPQFNKKRKFDYHLAVNGLRQILWGLFKKIVIADNCAKFVNIIFTDSGNYSGSTLVVGAIFFAFQIYGDFSGYSDIAIGIARLFGFDLMRNFAFPYFSRDIAEFWRRWHISLSTWFRDYLYIPLGGSRGGTAFKIRNTFIIFLVSGFWHGASWTFIVWGGLNALFFLPLLLAKKNRNHIDIVARNTYLPNIKDFFRILLTFSLTTLAWIFFRADSVSHALEYISGIFNSSLFTIPEYKPLYLFLLLAFFITTEWRGRRQQFALQKIALGKPKVLRWSFYVGIIFLMGMYMQTDETPFIYFQF